nr:PREDICTED: synaptotagmin-like protein 2 isoform X7 [Lepisosteus oculatus]
MIDLSYLTEEEQEMIMTVLKRDAELKRAEEDRIKHLQKTLRDSSRLKYMTGEWFYETKSKRHRDKIHGSDIIRASMRQKKPVTLLELSQSKAEKPSFVNSEKRDIFIPPELSGLIEEPEEEQEEERKSDHPSLETQGDKLKKTATPSVKQRQNPFNSMSDGEETADEREVHLTNGALQPVKTSEGEILPPAKNAIPSVSNLSSENPSVPQGDIKQAPVPKKRTKVFRLQDSFSDSDGPFPKQNGRGDLHSNVSTPRGILKHSPSCSSNDSEMVQNNSNSIIHHLEPAGDGTPNLQGAPPPKVADGMGCIKERMEEFSFNSLDRKQVRFSPAVRQGNHRTASAVEDGRELGEHDLLDLDFMTPSDVEAGSKSEKSNQGNGGGNGPPFSEAFGVGPLEPEDPSLKPRAPETETSLSSLLPANELKTSLPEDTEGPLSEAPGHSASSPRSHTRVNLDWRERDTDQHEYHAETYAPQVSNIQSSSNEKGNDEDQNPITRALRRSSTRPVSSAKSLEDITALPSKERSKNTSRDELVLSVENDQVSELEQSPKEIVPRFSTVPSTPTSKFSDSEKIKKMSRSVPAFLQQESDGRDTDSTSENSFHIGRQRKIGSSLTNLSNSSGMASMSSVSGSVMSIYSGDFGNVDVTGNIQFAIDYVEQLNELHIFVVQCKDLAAADPKKNRSDPYVKSYLLPDKAKMGKRKTSVKKKTLNPTYNEILRYKISKETLKTQTLNLSVWHNDTFGRNSFLGEVDLDLSKWDWSNTQLNFFPLKPRTPSGLQFTDYRGEMRLALRFLPQISQSKNTPNTGEVHIWVKDCKSLPAIRGTAIDPFVKCSVLPDTSRKSRQKTRVLKKTANPVFNHTMVYDGFRVEDLREACVELTVWDHDRLANHFLGGLRLGLGTGKSYGAVVDWMDSNTDEATLWERMIDSPNEWVEDVLPLRMLMMAKSSWK